MLDFYIRWGIESDRLHHVTNSQRRYGKAQISPLRKEAVRFFWADTGPEGCAYHSARYSFVRKGSLTLP